MEIRPCRIEGLFEVDFIRHQDQRGAFIKTFNRDQFAAMGLESSFVESYYSISSKDVIRGLHFQRPPNDHVKLVYCNRGSALDLVVDLRLASPTFGECMSFTLKEADSKGVYIPKGCAHGFLSLEDKTTMTYQTSTIYVPEDDMGIKWDSVNFNWPNSHAIVSERDRAFPKLDKLESPFK